jgi:hypothetical protein
MRTKFSKLGNHPIPLWSQYLGGADAWLFTYQTLDDHPNEIGWGMFYVKPYALAFTLELYVKAIVAYSDTSFNAKSFSHKTSEIISAYSNKIDVLKELSDDHELMDIIKEYEKTIDVKFGEMSVAIYGEDTKRLEDTVYKLREIIEDWRKNGKS